MYGTHGRYVSEVREVMKPLVAESYVLRKDGAAAVRDMLAPPAAGSPGGPTSRSSRPRPTARAMPQENIEIIRRLYRAVKAATLVKGDETTAWDDEQK